MSFTLSVINLNGRPVLTAVGGSTPGQFNFEFAGNPASSYSVLASTNLLLPLVDWTTLGTATLISNDLFQYVDVHTANYSQRFYQIHGP